MRKLLTTVLAVACSVCMGVAQVQMPERHLVVPSIDFFIPHWYIGIQGGGAYDLGEDDFQRLLSPAAQVQIGWQFSKPVALQLAVSGAWAKGRYAYPEVRYSWMFVQPTLELRFDLPTIFAGWDAERRWNIYALLGGGVAYSWGNDEACEADQYAYIHFSKLWEDYRWNPMAKAGLGADIRLAERLHLNLEANANMLPDHFNSKLGRHNNKDWHFNALLGLKIDLGPSSGSTDPLYEINEPIIYEPVPETVAVEEPDTVLDIYNIQFEINKSIIRPSQVGKLTAMLKFLHANPKAKVQLTGYADKQTGTRDINDRLSRERVRVVSNYLIEHGLDESRIRRRARGDRIQPYDMPEDNRVTICVVYELINPETQY